MKSVGNRDTGDEGDKKEMGKEFETMDALRCTRNKWMNAIWTRRPGTVPGGAEP
jgi:hypothetical protein